MNVRWGQLYDCDPWPLGEWPLANPAQSRQLSGKSIPNEILVHPQGCAAKGIYLRPLFFSGSVLRVTPVPPCSLTDFPIAPVPEFAELHVLLYASQLKTFLPMFPTACSLSPRS